MIFPDFQSIKLVARLIGKNFWSQSAWLEKFEIRSGKFQKFSIGKIFKNFNWEKFEILGLESLRNWGFCSVGLKLMKLTCVID